MTVGHFCFEISRCDREHVVGMNDINRLIQSAESDLEESFPFIGYLSL